MKKTVSSQHVEIPVRRMGRGDRLSNGDTPPADVHLTLPPEDYDRADAIAKRNRTSIQRVIREALKRLFDDDSGTLET